MSVQRLRIAAALIPAALLLHEGVYALSGGGLGNSHSYYELAVPVAVTIAAAVAVGALLLPLLGGGERDSRRLAPFATAAALTLIFVAQELAEALLLGGGTASLASVLASAWILPPLALLLGALVAAAVESLARAGDLLLALSSGSSAPGRPCEQGGRPRPGPVAIPAISPLAFGLACRPPPPAGT